MRALAVVKVAAVALVIGCTMHDKHRAYFHDDSKYPEAFSATHLGQGFDESSVVDFLSPAERAALHKTDWHMAARDSLAESAAAGDLGVTAPGGEPSTGDKIAGATMSVLGMGITVGAIVAPFFLY
jgi:hypothetical protein